ncbi:UNVERIFIED_ORG: N-acetyltransferase [Bacillus sp. AZ43]
MLYPLSYGGSSSRRRAVAAPEERLSGPPGNTRHTRLVTRSETQVRMRGLPCRVHVSSRQRRRGMEGRRRMDTKVVDVPEKGRFEIRVDDRVVGLASYHVDGSTMTLPHTEVDPSMGGKGIGTALVAGVLDAARERGLTVLPYCSFVRHYIQQHPELVDLVAADDRPHFGLATADR